MTIGELRAKTPVHLWVVGIVSLLWNLGGGGSDYVLTKLENEAYLDTMASAVGIEVPAVQAYFEAFPLWMNVAWALGVWGAVAGSLLLLFRSRYAYHAFIVSLFGIVVSTIYQFSDPLPGSADSSIPAIMSVIVPLITVALILYARRQTQTGVLR